MSTSVASRKDVKDIVYLVLLQGLNYAIPIIVLPYLIDILQPERYGYFGFALSVCQYLVMFVDFGFNLSATKRLSLHKDDTEKFNRIFSATVYAKMILLLISLLFLVCISLIPQYEAYRTILFIMFIMVLGNTFLFVFLFQSTGKIKWVSIANAIAKLTILPLTFIFVRTPDDYLKAAYIHGSVYVFAALISIIVLVRHKLARLVNVSMSEVRNETKESVPIFLSQAATSVYTVFFVMTLGYFSTPVEVGLYSAVERIMRALCCLGLIPILQVYYPKVSQLSVTDRAYAFTVARKILWAVLVYMTLLSASLFAFFPYLLQLFGSQYSAAVGISRVMSIIPIFIGAGGVLGQLYLLALGDSSDKRNFSITYFIVAIVSIVLVLWLTPSMESMGTAISLFIAELLVAILMFYFVKRNVRI